MGEEKENERGRRRSREERKNCKEKKDDKFNNKRVKSNFIFKYIDTSQLIDTSKFLTEKLMEDVLSHFYNTRGMDLIN